METQTLTSIIDTAFDRRADITPGRVEPELASALDHVIAELNAGRLRVAEKIDGSWVTHQWIKKAVLLYFRTHDNAVIEGPATAWFDKVPMRFNGHTDAQFRAAGIRVVPQAIARAGTYIGRNVILMPSYVNIGAYVDEGTMVDTWATVGSCAQIGRNVHLSGGVGIGGVLEPLQAGPVVIEDDCFIGARSEVVEGVRIGRGSVLSMGVFISSTSKIVDRATGETFTGEVPPYSVVVPGALPGKPLPDGSPGPSLSCAVIVKRVDERTRAKTAINELLRD